MTSMKNHNMNYIFVSEDEHEKKLVKLPIQEDGTLLWTTFTSHFPGCSGLRYIETKTSNCKVENQVPFYGGKFYPPSSDQSVGTQIFYCIKEKAQVSQGTFDKESNLEKESYYITRHRFDFINPSKSEKSISSKWALCLIKECEEINVKPTIKFIENAANYSFGHNHHQCIRQQRAKKCLNDSQCFGFLLKNQNTVSSLYVSEKLELKSKSAPKLVQKDAAAMALIEKHQISGVYRVREGTINMGYHFETLFVASLVLDLVLDENVEDFRISTNQREFEPFDDVVIEVKTTNKTENNLAVLIKHTNISGTSAARKHRKHSVVFVKKLLERGIQFRRSDFKHIFFTNRETIFPETDLKGLAIIKPCQIDPLLERTFGEGSSYEIIADEKALIKYSTLFNRFFLYSTSLNARQLELTLCQKFKQTFNCSKYAFNDYLKFIVDWSRQSNRREKLSKYYMKKLILTRVLLPFVQPLFTQLDVIKNDKANLFLETMQNFDVTVVDQQDHKSYSTLCRLWDIQKLFKEITQVPILDKAILNIIAKNNIEMSDLVDEFLLLLSFDEECLTRIKASSLMEDLCQIFVTLWLLGKCPLVVKYDASVVKAITLCRNANEKEKLILLYDENITENFDGLKVFRNLDDLDENSDLYKSVVKSFFCSLQKKEIISFENLIGKTRELKRYISVNQLLLSVDNYLLIGDQEYLPDLYISRHLSRYFIDHTFLEKINRQQNVNKKRKVIIDGYNTDDDFIESLRKIDVGSMLDSILCKDKKSYMIEKISIIVASDYYDQEKFDNLCLMLGDKYVYHQFRLYNGKLEWVRSRGGVEDLKEFKVEEFVTEDEFCTSKFDSNLIVFCGEPGLGKSTLLKYLKNKTFPTSWTLLIYARDLSRHFRQHGADIDAFYEHVLHEAKKNYSKYDFDIFKVLLKSGRILFMWDGLDEVSVYNLQAVTNIIDHLCRNGFKQCITSRNSLKEYLENKFSVIATTIKHFEKNEQREYIRRRLNNEGQEIETLLEKLENTLFNYTDICGIPLQIYMLTELLLKDREKYHKAFSLVDLYEHFITEKFNIYFQEKENVCDVNDIVVARNEFYKKFQCKLYESLAFATFFPDKQVEDDEIHKMLNDTKEFIDPVGIITKVDSNEIACFTHSTYAEYFAALFLSKNYKKMPDLSQYFFDEKYKNVRFLFDLILAKDRPVHIAVLYKNLASLTDFSETKDHGGRTPLHLACSWGQAYPPLKAEHSKNSRYEYVVFENEAVFNKQESLENLQILENLSQKYDPKEIDDVYKLNAFSYADRSLNFFELGILSKRDEVCLEDLHNYKHLPSLLYYAAVFNFPSIFVAVKERALIRTNKGDSLLSVAARHGCREVCFLLLRMYPYNVDDTNDNGDTPLHVACQNGHVEVVNLLIAEGADVFIQNKDHKEPLHLAVARKSSFSPN